MGAGARVRANPGWRVLRRAIGAHPRLYYLATFPNARNRRVRTTAATDLVIEGYPRSGNSFALHAFLRAQPTAVNVAHHLHVPAQVVRAARLCIPALVLVRTPADAIISHMLREPRLSVNDALEDYIQFYSVVRRYAHACVIAAFDDVVGDFGAVVRRVNRRFGTDFREFDHTQANVEAVFRVLEDINVQQGTGSPMQVAAPSRAKRERRTEAVERFAGEASADVVDKANDLFKAMQNEAQNRDGDSAG